MKKKIGITLAVIVLLVCMISVVALAGCNKVKVDNAQEASEANWAKKDNKTATTSVTITDAKIALGVDGDNEAISVTASAKVDLTRKWENGTLTIDIVAQPTDFKIELSDPALNTIIGGFIDGEKALINQSAMSKIKFTGQAFYNYGGETTKNIGVRNLKVEGLAQAIPALKEIITEDPWPIYFDNNRTKSEVSYDVTKINGLLSEGTVGKVIGGIFNEDYTLDVVSIIDDLLLNQTLLDFSDPTNASLTDGQYTNTVSALDNLDFLMDVWNNISADGKAMLQEFVGPASEIEIGDFTLPIGEILSIFLSADQFGDLLPNLLKEAVTDGRMSVIGTVEDNMFKALTMTTTGVSIDLDNAQVTDLIGVIESLLPGGGIEINGAQLDIPGIINAVADGSAYVSLGNIKVDSNFTWQ